MQLSAGRDLRRTNQHLMGLLRGYYGLDIVIIIGGTGIWTRTSALAESRLAADR